LGPAEHGAPAMVGTLTLCPPYELPMLLPGIKINTSTSDHIPVDQMQFMRFNGKTWERFGELQTGN
jgi:hypothetical protein